MAIWTTLSIILAIMYAIWMSMYIYGWLKTPHFQLPKNYVPRVTISVIVPARNEARNIAACLESILVSQYPTNLFEIIVIDDHSEDETAAVVATLAKSHKHQIRLIRLHEHLSPTEKVTAFKKKGIELAVGKANGELIVTTDADCLVSPDWLLYFAAAFENPATVAVAAPVVFFREKNFFERFQSLDFLGMMGVTAAGIHLGFQRMGNGASLAYRKSVFNALGGFKENDHRASGDDVFLMQKIAKYHPNGILFLKSGLAIVRTYPQTTFSEFLQQRIRWGTKNAAYQEKLTTFAALAVFLFSWTLFLNMVLVFFFPAMLFPLFLFQFLTKLLFDAVLLGSCCDFFGRRDLLRIFIPALFMHLFYIVGVGTASVFLRKYSWKGRKVT